MFLCWDDEAVAMISKRKLAIRLVLPLAKNMYEVEFKKNEQKSLLRWQGLFQCVCCDSAVILAADDEQTQ